MTKKRLCITCINDEMEIFLPNDIKRPEDRFYGNDARYPTGWEPGVRVILPSRGLGTIANHNAIKKCMTKYGGILITHKPNEIPIIFDDDPTGHYWLEPGPPLEIVKIDDLGGMKMQTETGEIRRYDNIPEAEKPKWSKPFKVGDIILINGVKMKLFRIKQQRKELHFKFDE